MEQTLQDRIRERAYHLWNNGCGQGDDHYWLMAEREVLAEIAAESLLASTAPETLQSVPSAPAKTAALPTTRATTTSSPKIVNKAAAPTLAEKGGKPVFAKSAVVTPTNSKRETRAKPTLATRPRLAAVPQAVDDPRRRNEG